MSDPQKAVLGAQASEQVQETSLLDQIVTEGRLARGAETTEKGKNLVRDFVDQVLKGAMTVSKDAEAMITARIAEIDRLVSAVERSAAPRELSEAGRHLARVEVPVGPE
jgi:Uncharacterized protein conserved in bacteria